MGRKMLMKCGRASALRGGEMNEKQSLGKGHQGEFTWSPPKQGQDKTSG